MTKRPYNFGDRYILRQMRLGLALLIVYPEDKSVGIHVTGAQPLLARAD